MNNNNIKLPLNFNILKTSYPTAPSVTATATEASSRETKVTMKWNWPMLLSLPYAWQEGHFCSEVQGVRKILGHFFDPNFDRYFLGETSTSEKVGEKLLSFEVP